MNLPILALGVFLVASVDGRAGSRSKIFKGRELEPHSRPWLGWLRIGTRRVKCGCALITPLQVLTAASCVQQPVVDITLGDHDRDQPEGTEQVFSAAAITVHPDFNMSRGYAHDLAVVQLDRAADTSGPTVSTIPLLPFDQLTKRVLDKRARVAGWGLEADTSTSAVDSQSPVPLEYTVLLASPAQCRTLGVPGDSTCYEPLREADAVTCEGDVGGPLVVKRKRVWNLAGVISGYDTRKGCTPGKKAAVKITPYVSWLNSILTFVKPSPQ